MISIQCLSFLKITKTKLSQVLEFLKNEFTIRRIIQIELCHNLQNLLKKAISMKYFEFIVNLLNFEDLNSSMYTLVVDTPCLHSQSILHSIVGYIKTQEQQRNRLKCSQDPPRQGCAQERRGDLPFYEPRRANREGICQCHSAIYNQFCHIPSKDHEIIYS